MQTKYPLAPGSVPNPGACLKAGVLPEYFQRNDVKFVNAEGKQVVTCHIASDGRRFNWRDVYDGQRKWEYLHFLQFSYTDEEGKVQVADVTPRNPHLIHHGPIVTKVGYVTKLNGLRWGVIVQFDYVSGDMQIITDQGSPIVGTLVQLI